MISKTLKKSYFKLYWENDPYILSCFGMGLWSEFLPSMHRVSCASTSPLYTVADYQSVQVNCPSCRRYSKAKIFSIKEKVKEINKNDIDLNFFELPVNKNVPKFLFYFSIHFYFCSCWFTWSIKSYSWSKYLKFFFLNLIFENEKKAK